MDRELLIVDDEKRMTDSLHDLLAPLGYAVETANSGDEAIRRLKERKWPVVVTDLRMQSVGGLDILRYLAENAPRTLAIVITGYASTESAIEAVHYHAFDYIRKPFEFDQLKRVIDRAFQKIELDQLREDTTAMITHDIKVPLTSILGFASLIYNDEKETFHPRAKEFTEMIRSSARKILALVDNYLTSARHESDTLHLHAMRTRIAPMIEELLEATAQEALRRGMTIEASTEDAPEHAVIDEALIYRAVANLLYNAVKYGDPEEPIRLVLKTLEAGESDLRRPSLHIEVINKASEFHEQHLEELFHRFRRSDKHTGVEGSGIGLYVVHAVATAHEGQAHAEYRDGDRVAFKLLIPLDLKPLALGKG